MPGSSDDESVDSLDEWLKGGPSSKKAVAVGAHVVGRPTTTGDDEDSDLDSVDREIERMMREARAKAGSASGRKEGESSSSPPPMPDGEDDSDLDSVDREIERMLREGRERSSNKRRIRQRSRPTRRAMSPRTLLVRVLVPPRRRPSEAVAGWPGTTRST